MGFLEIFLIGVGLSMDAFAVSICKGLSAREMRWSGPAAAGLYFGAFQALMPLVGYLLGSGFAGYIEAWDHWIAFVMLGIIGVRMVQGSLSPEECPEPVAAGVSFSPRSMLPLAVATSIDALVVGVTFAFLNVNILPAVCLIGATTFCFSFAGVRIGAEFGSRWGSRAELAGGVILVLIGVRILVEHTLGI